MKKKLALFLCATLLLSVMLPIISASAMMGPQWVWTADGNPLRLRSTPDASNNKNVLIKIPYGTKLIGCQYVNSTWTWVTYKGYEGYVMTKFLMSEEPPYHPVYPTNKPTAKPTAKPTSKPVVKENMFSKMQKANYYAVVDPNNGASFGNLRWAPSEDQPVMRIYYPGYQLKVLYEDGNWCQVLDEASSVCGFMRSFLLQPLSVGAAQ